MNWEESAITFPLLMFKRLHSNFFSWKWLKGLSFAKKENNDHRALCDMSAQMDGASAQSALSFFCRSQMLMQRGGASLTSLPAHSNLVLRVIAVVFQPLLKNRKNPFQTTNLKYKITHFAHIMTI